MEDRVWSLIDSKTLVSGAKWEDAQSTVRALTFGVMVELAKNRIEHYHSDLYHDALWISENLVGPMQFDWVVRESGTHIGNITRYVKDDEWANSARYRFDIREDSDRKWVLDIHEAGPIVKVIPHFCEECGLQPSQWVDYMQMWLCSDFCTGKAENRLNGVEIEPIPVTLHTPVYGSSIVLPTDIDYSENEAYQIQFEKNEDDPIAALMMNENINEEEAIRRFQGIKEEDLGAKYRDKMFEEIVIPDDFVWPEGFLPHLSNEPLPESVVEAVAKMEPIPIDATIDLLMGTGEIPTLRNKSNTQRKETKMDSVRELLEEKLSDLQTKLEELEDAEREVEDAKEIAQRNVEAVEEAINSLDLDLEDIYLSIDVSFNA